MLRLVPQREKILPVSAFDHRLGQGFELVDGDVSKPVGDLLRAGNLQSLAALNRLNEESGFEQRIVGARIEPRHPAAHELDLELACFEVEPIQVGDLELAARAWLQRSGHPYNIRIVEVETCDGVAR